MGSPQKIKATSKEPTTGGGPVWNAEAKGVAVIVKAEHFCMTARGVKEHESDMLTSVLRGILRDDDSLRLELFSLLNNMKGMK